MEEQFDAIAKTFTKKDFLSERKTVNRLGFWNGHIHLTVVLEDSWSKMFRVKLCVDDFSSSIHFSKASDINLDGLFDHLLTDVTLQMQRKRNFLDNMITILKPHLRS